LSPFKIWIFCWAIQPTYNFGGWSKYILLIFFAKTIIRAT
jgi:hypothetical protein